MMDENFLETEGEKPEVQVYEMRRWAGVVPVYVCLKCDMQTGNEDKMKRHVLGHEGGING